MLSADETRIFAILLKRLGGEVKITQQELASVEGWRVEFEQDYRTTTWSATLTRVGETFEGEATGLYPASSPSRSRLSAQHRFLPMRRSFLASEPFSEGAREIPSDEERSIKSDPNGDRPGEHTFACNRAECQGECINGER